MNTVVARWKVIYAGKPDSFSKAGVAAPSWHTFDRRVWGLGDFELELTNLHKKTPTKIATYKVKLTKQGKVLQEREGYDWQKLVRDLKESIN